MLDMTAAGMLILAAAALVERGAARVSMPRRWCWLAGMMGMLAVPAVATVFGSPTGGVVTRPMHPPTRVPPRPAELRLHDSGPQPSRPLAARLVEAQASVAGALRPFDTTVLAAWVLVSGVLLLRALRDSARLERHSRSWRLHQQDGVGRPSVWVSDDVGPAAFGVSRGAIVIPEWANALPPLERRLVLLHERSHVAANDPRLVWIGMALVILLPWHLPLRAAFRRMQRAIEFDCDRRVLSRPTLARRYAKLLLHVAARRADVVVTGWTPGAARGQAATLSFGGAEPELARRLRALAAPRVTWQHRLTAVAGASIAVPLVLAAAALPMPSRTVQGAREPQVVVSPAVSRDPAYLRTGAALGAHAESRRSSGDSIYFARNDSLVIEALRRSRPELLRLASTVAPYVAVALTDDNTVAAHSIRAGEPPSVSQHPLTAALRRTQAAARAGLGEPHLDDVFAARLTYVADDPSTYLDSLGISHLLVGHDPLTVFWVRFRPRTGD